jgi:hypothetical protein
LYLNNVVVLVVGMGASGADAIAHAVQAEEITLASVEHPMNRAIEEEIGLEHWFQPGRPLRRLFHLGVVFLLLLLFFLLVHELHCPSLHRNFHNDDLSKKITNCCTAPLYITIRHAAIYPQLATADHHGEPPSASYPVHVKDSNRELVSPYSLLLCLVVSFKARELELPGLLSRL